MARPHTPTAVLKAQGKLEPGTQNAARFAAQGRENEMVPDSLLPNEPPAHLHLKDTEIACWKRVMEILPAGVAGCSDEISMHTLVQLWAKQIIGDINVQEIGHLRGLCIQFGMTPAARSKVIPAGAGGKSEAEDPTAQFGNK